MSCTAAGESTGFDVPMDWIEGFNGAAKNFIDCIISGEQPVMDFQFARKTAEAALGVYQSSEMNMPLDLATIE